MNFWQRIRRFFDLGTRSPSRVWSRRTYDESPPEPRRPWYAARGPLDPYEWPELKRRARFVRRLIRRHWFALMFEPRGPIATSIKAYMEAKPERPRKPEPWEECGAKLLELQRLIDSGTLVIDPKAAEEFAKQCGVVRDG